ncbi:MAG: translocation/assembly module TamB domain-containing protein [Nitrospirae bacterium]|nr:translocation/assembly module TamB domain-containing protein [Nitrospirota bacterium]
MKNAKGLRRVLYLLFFAIVIGLIIFISRGPHISNALKRIILPELEAAFGQSVIAQKIYINIFPLFIEAKGLKVFDENGNRIVFANRVKGYIELSGLLSRHLSFRRLVIKEPEISMNREQLDDVVRNIKAYLEKERRPTFKVRIKVLDVINGAASLRDNDLKGMIGIRELVGELILGEDTRLKTSIKKFDIRKEGWPELTGDVNASLVFKKDEVEIKSLDIGSYGSEFKYVGFYSEGKGTLKTEIALLVDSVKRIFNLKQSGEGRISARGDVKFQISNFKFQNLKDIFVDLKLKGNFYLQTLMELLKVKDRVEGLVDFQGEMKGRLSDISGKAKARLQKGNLFDVEIDSLTCDVTYHDGVMRFKNGNGELYSGKAHAEASLKLPEADFFTLSVDFNSIDSRAALKLIGWEPEIPPGKVDGGLVTSGRKFNPDGWFDYEVGGGQGWREDNVLSRIRNIKGTYSMRGYILSFSSIQLNTPLSSLNVEGTVDITKKTLNLKGRLDTNDVSDLTLPYYRGVKGRGDFSGEITGTFNNPEISVRANIWDAFIEGYRTDSIASHFSYNKNLLNIRELVLKSPDEEHRIQGKIFFPEAKELFELSKPVYQINASITNAEPGKVIQVFYKDFSAAGRLSADLKIRGKGKELSFEDVILRKGKSTLRVEGKIISGERFSYKASSERILLKDIGLDRMPEDAVLNVQSEGHGTFKNPTITLSATVVGGTFKGRSIGSGIINAAIKNRDILLDAALFNERIKLKGNGYLDDKLPWTAELDIQPGRYDFILSSILKDIPEDLLLNLKGRVELKGDRRHITASANINQVTLALFGYSFSNDSDIKVQINNRELSFQAFTIRSGSTSFRLRGGIEIGKEYDILLEGSSSLSPLKGLSKRIEHLKGDADFVFSITGKWEKPRINGGLSVSNASFGLKDYYPRISSINGYLYIDEDRIIVQRLSGKLGGGEIELAGLVYLKAFGIKRFYLEAHLDNITISISKDFNINFRGDLLYKGTPTAQSITGDIKINRSKYKEKVEWKSWLLKAKAKEKPKAEVSELERAELNIKISGSDNIYIDNNIARAPVRVDIVLRGTISRPVLFGRLELREGSVYFRNNEFRIIHASADFADPNRINPVMEIIAGTVVKGYSIKLNLEGQMEHFNLSLSSDPPLEEMDILALLTVGQIGKQLKGLEGGIGAGEATSFLTGKIQDVLEERLRTVTGLDRLQVDPYVSKTTGTVGPRVTVSKKLISDRLFVTYTSPLGSTEEQILKMEYLLDKNISLIGIRDEKGSVGGDIKFRFGFK